MSTRTGIERQNSTIGEFKRTLFNESRRTEPTYWEKEIARGKAESAKVAHKTPQPRTSFYNPTNPLNGFKAKSKAEQKEISSQLRKSNRAKATTEDSE
jgi:hypothetical protein